MNWSDIPRVYKIASGVIGAALMAIGTATGWLFATFETASAAEAKWAQHNQAIACRTVYELEEKKRAYLERLRFDANLTPEQRQWLDREITALEKKIARIDPDGQC